MAFYGYYFSFDGIPCTEYGLMMYDIDYGNSESTNTLSTNTKIVEDRIARRYAPLHYGIIDNTPLEFEMTFGADINAIDKDVHLDRWDMESIANWLTGHSTYKWLEISQPDMEMFRYKCFITDLKHIDIGNIPWVLKCTVVCDSPFAYLFPEVFKYSVNGNTEIELLNKSSCRGYYKPKMNLTLSEGGTFSVKNVTDNNRTMQLTGLPASAKNIFIDCENEILSCPTESNLYQYFNFNFLRLCRGKNKLIINGTGNVEISCEFPVNIGG